MKVRVVFLLLVSFTLSLSASTQTLATPPAAKATQSTASAQPKTSPAAAAKPIAVAQQTAPEPETPPKVAAVETKIQRLISEREQLVLKYDYLKTRESSFWGNASKKDMAAVIEALREILQKDSEIIQAVSEQALETRRAAAQRAAQLEVETKRLNSQVQGDKRVVTDNIYELKASLENSRNLNRRRERQIVELEEKVKTAKSAKFEHDAIAAFFAMLSLVLVGYIVRLRGRVKERHTPKKTMRKA